MQQRRQRQWQQKQSAALEMGMRRHVTEPPIKTWTAPWVLGRQRLDRGEDGEVVVVVAVVIKAVQRLTRTRGVD